MNTPKQSVCPRASTMPAKPMLREKDFLVHVIPNSSNNGIELDLSMNEFILVPPQGVTERFVLRPCASAQYSFHKIGFKMTEDLVHTTEGMQCTFPTPLLTFDSSIVPGDYPEVTKMPIVYSSTETTEPMSVTLEPRAANPGRGFTTIEEDSYADFVPIRDVKAKMSDKLSEEGRYIQILPRITRQPRSKIRTVSFAEDCLAR